MTDENRWIGEAWHRDWLFWTGAVVATVNLMLLVLRGTREWWQLPLAWLLTFGFIVALLGFIRTAVRTYRAP